MRYGPTNHPSALSTLACLILAWTLGATAVNAAPPPKAAQQQSDSAELDVWGQEDDEDPDGSPMELRLGPRFPLGLTAGVRGSATDVIFAQADLGAMVMMSYAASYRGVVGATLYRTDNVSWDIWGGGMGFVAFGEPTIDSFGEAVARFTVGALLGEGRPVILPHEGSVQPFWVTVGTGLTWKAGPETSIHFDVGAMALTNEQYDFDIIDIFSIADSYTEPNARPLVPTASLGLVFEL
jgi:hypothetical protein